MNWLNRLADVVWQTSLSAGVLVALGLLVLVCFRRVLPAWARYGIWVLVFLRLMVPVAPPASFSVWNLGKVEERTVAPVVVAQPGGYKPAIQQTKSLGHERSEVGMVPVIWMVGVIGWMAFAVARHQRLARWVRGQEACDEARVLAVVERAREVFRVRTKVGVICHERFDAPAVFGSWRTRVLLPEAWVKQATDEELYVVLLHEMAHVKCRDALVNWICIFVRAVHWFNPLVWYAFRRLRRERELFCDALVMRRLQPPQRIAYGNALIRIAEHLSGAAASPTLVPILQHKPEINRRIHMIANYKPMAWALSAIFALMLIALAGITFTRAADRSTPAAATPTTSSPDSSKRLDFLKKAIDRQQDLVHQLQTRADELHAKLNAQAMDPIVSPGPNEMVQRLQAQQIEGKAEFERLAALYDHLNKLDRTDLIKSISTAAPDAQLTDLMKQRDTSEQKLADVMEDHAKEHPDVKRIARVLAQINKQIEDRTYGIMRGLEARRDAERTRLHAMEKSLVFARQHHFENVLESRPYQDAVQDLRSQQELLQRLNTRLIEEQVDLAVENGKTN